jgi:predicted small metal-binding protein
MSKALACRDVGLDCPVVIRGESEEEVLTKAAQHADADHGIKEITPELLAKVKSVIKTE